MNKFVKACMVMAAVAAFLVVPSISSAAPTLTQTTGNGTNHVIPAGTNIIATNVAHPASGVGSNTLMETPLGPVECATATLTGTLETNSGTHIAGNIETAEFRGTPGSPHINSNHCKAPGGTAVVTPNHTTNDPVDNGQASLPWCITANELNDKFTVRGGKCSEATRPLTFDLHTSVAGTCTYEKASVTGEYTTHPVDALLWIKKEKFVKNTGSVFCPSSGELTMGFTLTTDNNHVSGEPLNIT